MSGRNVPPTGRRVAERCPGCGSTKLIGKTFGMGDGSIVERGCSACGLSEWFDTRNDGYGEWLARWRGARDLPRPRATNQPAPRRAPAPKVRRPRDPRRGRSGIDGSPLAPLFDAVIAAPWDDAPREAYAAAIEKRQPTRAAWIRRQIEEWHWRRGKEMSPEWFSYDATSTRSALDRKAEALQDGWGKQIEPYAIAAPEARHDREFKITHGYGFERGFVSYVRVSARHLLDPKVDLFSLAPLEHLRIEGAQPHLRELLALPQLAQLKSLALGWSGVKDEHVASITRSPLLTRCQWLGLQTNELTYRGVTELLECEAIRKMPAVMLGGNPCDPAVQVGYDCHGTIAVMFLPEVGEQAEQRFGRIDWLHLSHTPDPFDMQRLGYWD
jgi:hypothetical protein